MNDRIKYLLEESKMPKAWYNISADLPKPLSPVLHPGTLKPVGPDDLAPLFPNGTNWSRSFSRKRNRNSKTS